MYYCSINSSIIILMWWVKNYNIIIVIFDRAKNSTFQKWNDTKKQKQQKIMFSFEMCTHFNAMTFG